MFPQVCTKAWARGASSASGPECESPWHIWLGVSAQAARSLCMYRSSARSEMSQDAGLSRSVVSAPPGRPARWLRFTRTGVPAFRMLAEGDDISELQGCPPECASLCSKIFKVAKATAAEAGCKGWVRLSNDSFHLFSVRSFRLCEEIELLHRSDVLQEGFVRVLSTPDQLVLQPTMVVCRKKFLRESRPKLLHGEHVLANK